MRKDSGAKPAAGAWRKRLGGGVGGACAVVSLLAGVPGLEGMLALAPISFSRQRAPLVRGSLGMEGEVTTQEDEGIGPKIDDVELEGNPSRSLDGSLHFSDVVRASFTLHSKTLDLQETLVDGRRLTWHSLEDGWHATKTYTEGGPYRLPLVRAVDAWGLASSNASQVEVAPAFWVDRTAPVVTSAVLEGDGITWLNESQVLVASSTKGSWPRLMVSVCDAQGIAEVYATFGSNEKRLPLEVMPNSALPGSTSCDVGVSIPKEGLDRSFSLHILDLAGNERVWGLGETGAVSDAVDSDSSCTAIKAQVQSVQDGAIPVHPQRILLDESVPEVSLVAPDGSDGSPEDETRFAEGAVWTVRVQDDHASELLEHCGEQEVLHCERTNRAGEKSVSVLRVSDLSLAEDGSLLGHVRADEDGAYLINAQVTDIAGNQSAESSVAFEVDTRVPDVGVYLVAAAGGPDAWQALPDGSVFNGAAVAEATDKVIGGARYYPSSMIAWVCVEDDHFDPSLVQVTTAGTLGAWQEEGSRHLLPVLLGAGQNKITVSARDILGHESQTVGFENVVVDLDAPQVESTNIIGARPRSLAGRVLAFREPVSLELGLIDSTGTPLVQLAGASPKVGTPALLRSGGANSSSAYGISLGDGLSLSGNAQLVAQDMAGNESRTSLWGLLARAAGVSIAGQVPDGAMAIVDAVSPRLALHGPSQGGYFPRAQNVGLTVAESSMDLLRELDSDQVVLEVRRGEEAPGNSLGQPLPGSTMAVESSVTVASLERGDAGWQTSLQTQEDGVYQVSTQLRDVAGNISSESLPTFVVDTHAPVIHISLDPQEVTPANRERIASIKIVEKNFDSSLVRIDTDGTCGPWTSKDDEHVAQVRFNTEGEHHLSVACSDLAGNESERQSMPNFSLDFTPPTIVVGGIEDEHAYAGDVEAWAKLSDAGGLDATSVSAELYRGNGKKVEQPVVSWESGNAMVRLPLFAHTQEADDVYTLKISARDTAGNEAQSQTHFSINRFGSTFEVLSPLQQGIGHFRDAPDVAVREVNVCGSVLGEHSVRVTRGLETRELELSPVPGRGAFTLEDVRDGRGWSCATYRVGRQNFALDGTYRVSVSSHDRAGNKNVSVAPSDGEDAARVAFVVDTVAPEVSCSGVTDNQEIREDRASVDIRATDAEGVEALEVKLDGQPADLVKEASDRWRVEIPAEPGKSRELEIVARDAAGNEGSLGLRGFHVEGSPLLSVTRVLPMLSGSESTAQDASLPSAGLVAGVASAIGVAALALIRRGGVGFTRRHT